MASTYMNRTLAANNEKKLTISVWVKIAKVQEQMIVNSYYSGSYWGSLYFGSDGTLRFDDFRNSYILKVRSTEKYRDIGAWMHIVANFDCSIGSPTAKLYVNGSEVTYSVQTIYSQNATTSWNTDYDFQIGKGSSLGGNQFDGQMSDLYFIQGYTYDASTFGESDSTSGIWKPKTNPTINYGGTGGNSCHLKFENSGNMDLDSGSNNVSLTTSGTLTQNLDNPSNNFCTLNTLIPTSNITFSNGNTTMVSTTYSDFPLGTLGFKTGKFYYEAKMVSTHMKFGFAEVEVPQGDPDSASVIPAYWIYSNTSNVITANNHSGSNQSTRAGFTNWSANDILGLAIDLDNGKFYASLNGTWYNSADPANGTNALITSITARKSGDFVPFLGSGTSNARTNHINFGQGFFGTTAVASANADANGHGAFEYAVPNSFYAICTKNIKEFG